MQKSSSCPICKKSSIQAYQPFCSKRCQWIDLGHWLGERYSIPDDNSIVDDNDTDYE